MTSILCCSLQGHNILKKHYEKLRFCLWLCGQFCLRCHHEMPSYSVNSWQAILLRKWSLCIKKKKTHFIYYIYIYIFFFLCLLWDMLTLKETKAFFLFCSWAVLGQNHGILAKYFCNIFLIISNIFWLWNIWKIWKLCNWK